MGKYMEWRTKIALRLFEIGFDVFEIRDRTGLTLDAIVEIVINNYNNWRGVTI
jgi:hypothetical protein